LQQARSLLSSINPTYILSHQGWTYIVSEIEQGEVITLDKNHQLVSRTSTMGSHPCHISVSQNSNYLAITNYASGSVAMFLLEDKQPKKIRCFMTHEGHSLHEERQSSPHPHCSLFAQND
jgi:6-phosphogluconolactonase